MDANERAETEAIVREAFGNAAPEEVLKACALELTRRAVEADRER